LSELHIGAVTLIGETEGVHVQVTVLGAGMPGHRPLCGRVKMNAEEWASVNTSPERTEIERLRAEVEHMRPVYVAAIAWNEADHVNDADCRAGDCDSCPAREAEIELVTKIQEASHGG
jgi:hypothetical protein